MKFYETILRYPKTTIAIILLFTLFFGWHARNVNIDNSLEEFLPPDHYAMLQDKLVKNEFNSRELILIGVVNYDGIFNRRSLEKVQSISEKIHKLTVVRPEDELELKEWNSRLDERYTNQIEIILSGGVTVVDRGVVRSLRIEVMNDETVDNNFLLFLNELLLRLSPISEVISIADVDNITASEWRLTVEPLMAVISLSEIMLIAGGFFNLGFALFHLLFWQLFDWKRDLVSITTINRSVMQILNLCLTFLFLVMAWLSFFYRQEMITTRLGNALLIAFSLFWFLRMIEQVIFFGVKNRVSLAFTVIFLTGSVIFLIPLLFNMH